MKHNDYKNSAIAIAIVAVFIMPLHLFFAPIASMQSRRLHKKLAKIKTK